VVFTLQESTKSSKTTIRCFQDETALLNGFSNHVRYHDIDLYVHFNGQYFDWDFLYARACIASFIQSSGSSHQAIAQWRLLRTQYEKYMPYYNAYRELRKDFKKPEEQETKAFKDAEQELFLKMAEAMNHPLPKFGQKIWRQPTQTPYNAAIWQIQSQEDMEEFYRYFKPQPSIQPFFYCHRLRCEKVQFDIRAKCSAALGSQLLKTTEDGRSNMDLYLYIKTGPFGLDKFGLDACADVFLKNTKKTNILDHYRANPDKIELQNPTSAKNPYHMLNEYFVSKKPELNQVVADYCHQDVVVTDQLDEKLGISMELISMVKRYRVIAYHVTQRAQQFRFVTNVSFEIMDRFVLNSYDRTHKAPTYQGAAVLDPKTGLHGGPHQWVFCLDFASLYPTIMRERNLCCSTYILPSDVPRILKLVLEGKHPELLVVPYTKEYKVGESPLGKVTSTQPDKNTAYFAIKKTEETILPRFLERFGNDRGAVKKKMKICKNRAAGYSRNLKTTQKDKMNLDSLKLYLQAALVKVEDELRSVTLKDEDTKNELKEREKILKLDLTCLDVPLKDIPDKIFELEFDHMKYDGEQKAIKIGMNSVYGSMGVSNGIITGLQEIAMSITYFGRTYIYKTRDFAYRYAKQHPDFQHLDLEVIYGVSP
jgi:DNA polymerase elongation subunit (family B)